MSKKKFLAINVSIIAVLTAIFLVANIAMVVMFDFLTFLTSDMGLSFGTVEAEEAQAKAEKLVDKITAEGITLVRNEDDALPLGDSVQSVNLFGWASTALIVGGSGGSGGASGATVDIEKSLEDAGYDVNGEILAMYRDYQDAREMSYNEVEEAYHQYECTWDLPEPSINDRSLYTEEMLESAKAFSNVAILTLGRTSGEGIDLPEGYLSLTQEEKDLAKYLTENYAKVIVVLNSNAAMEIGYFEEIGVDAILYMPGPGKTGVSSLGKIISGEVNPSGHLVDTFAYDHKSAPNYYYANRQGTMTYEEYAFESAQTDKYFYVDYVEGIYVGYKWYETAAAEGYLDYDKTVQYPFGHGLSYTTFSKEVTDVRGDLNSDSIEIDVLVTNTGDVAGKEVVQIYATPEYYDGGIEKAYVDLVGFEKTGELAPNASETVTISVDPFEIASYDWNDANGDGKTGYVLEAGHYELKLMENSHDMIAVAAEYDLRDDIYIDEDPVTGEKIENLFDDAAGQEETEPVEYLSRADFAGTYPASKEDAEQGSNYGLVGRAASAAVKAAEDTSYEKDPDAKPVTTGADNGLTVADITGTDYDDPFFADTWEQLLDQMTLEDMTSLLGTCMYGTPEIESIGLEAKTMSEGPQGVSAWIAGITGANYPCQTYIALTWNKDIASEQGAMFAEEARAVGVSAMMAPATNIHRTPYCGRNFEYYSEDGFLSGKMAANVTYGAREGGLIMFVKHFGLNDQETHRGEYFTSLFTWCNEQAMREVFLKPFELAVKEGKTLGIMSSFNRVGGTWTGASKALLTDLLRTEWGFRGTVITDLYMGAANNEWWMDAEQGVLAGQDLWLTLTIFGGNGQSFDTSDPTIQNAMRTATKHVLYTLTQSTISPAPASPDWFYHIALPIDIAVGVLIAAYAVFIVVKAKQKGKEEKAAKQ